MELFDPQPMTVAEARIRLREAARKGTKCPCCGRITKVYKRRFHAEMGRFLVALVQAYKQQARLYGVRELFPSSTKASTDAAYLVHWKLLERGARGLYRPTQAGIDFCEDKLQISGYVYLLNNEVLAFSEEMTGINDVLER